MSVDLGDAFPLSISITDADGNLADATSVELKVTQPDGTIQTFGPIASTSTGIYEYKYETTAVGRHFARWEATGINASAFGTAFYVNPTDTGEFISLAQFRNHLRKDHTRDDEAMRTFIAASCAVINDRCGQVAPMTFTEDLRAVDGYVRLAKFPIISVESVASLPGLGIVSEGDRATGTTGWFFNSVTDAYRPLYIGAMGWYRVTYRAGMLDIPYNYILGALELAKHLWQNSQNNPGGGRPPVANDDVVINGVSYAMPYNVRQLLGLDKRPRIGVWVG